MQTRLTTRDTILYTLLALMTLLLVLLMYQIDRQWNKLNEMQIAVSEQAKDVQGVRNSISDLQGSFNGVVTTALNSLVAVKSSASVQSDAKSDSETKSISETIAQPAQNTQEKMSDAFQRANKASQQADYSQGDWKVNSFASTVKTISPLVSSDAYASDVQGNVLESLLIRNPDTLEWTGLIAKNWSVSDDGLTITFNLHENVRFSDGVALTAEDIEFTYRFIMNEAIKAPGERAFYEKIASVTASSPYQVSFVFKEPYFQALGAAGGLPILAKHFYQEYMDKAEEFNESKGLLLGSGPYRLADPKSWTSDQGAIELIRNGRYWGAVQPSFDKLVWKVIQNDSARLTTYRNGDIDLYTARPVEYDQLLKDEQIKEKKPKLGIYESSRGLQLYWLESASG